jgi:hypothetical protein
MDQSKHTEEITLKEIIFTFKDYVREFWNKKWWMILFIIPLGAFYFYNSYNDTDKYKANLDFTINDGSLGGGLSSLLGSFGLPGSGKINIAQILKVSKSRTASLDVLFSKMNIDSVNKEPDFLANHIIALFNLDKLWEKIAHS